MCTIVHQSPVLSFAATQCFPTHPPPWPHSILHVVKAGRVQACAAQAEEDARVRPKHRSVGIPQLDVPPLPAGRGRDDQQLAGGVRPLQPGEQHVQLGSWPAVHFVVCADQNGYHLRSGGQGQGMKRLQPEQNEWNQGAAGSCWRVAVQLGHAGEWQCIHALPAGAPPLPPL